MAIRKNVFSALAIMVLCAIFGYFAGKLIGHTTSEATKDLYRDEFTAAILESMETIQVGDTLPDFEFLSTEGELYNLHSLLCSKSIVCFVEPSCEMCREEMAAVAEALSEDLQMCHIFVSGGNPVSLALLSNELNLRSPILLDHNEVYATALGIPVYPFSIIVDRDGVIQSIIASKLTSQEILENLSGG